MLAGFLLAALYFVFDIFSQKDYEYTLENDTLSIDVIYGKKYRKTAHVLELKNMEVTAPHWHESVAKYKKNGGTEQLKKFDYTSYDDNVPALHDDHQRRWTQDQTASGSYRRDASHDENTAS